MDGASAVAAAAMNVEPGSSVLDLCAAPGGKSLMLASTMFAGDPPSHWAKVIEHVLVQSAVPVTTPFSIAVARGVGINHHQPLSA